MAILARSDAHPDLLPVLASFLDQRRIELTTEHPLRSAGPVTADQITRF